MVHKKSTYRLMYKNYGSEIRKNVWHENNALRLRRREEEMSHHSIDGSESDCECDESDEEEETIRQTSVGDDYGGAAGPRGILLTSDRQRRPYSAVSQSQKNHPDVPRLRFSPDHSPRASQQENVQNAESAGDRSGLYSDDRGDISYVDVTREAEGSQDPEQSRRFKIETDANDLGVMRPRSQYREYDLIPASREESSLQHKSKSQKKSNLLKSSNYPLTSQLTRTTRRNFRDRSKRHFIPCGSGRKVRTIGDKTTFNIHLNKDEIHPTALQASSLRNKEIEHLINKQRELTLEDWREKSHIPETVNHSSLWAKSKKDIFKPSRRPTEKLYNIPNRVQVFSNYCQHCGGRK